MLWEEIDMVGDNHQVADLKLRVHAAGGIANEEGLDTQLVHHAHGEGYLLHRVALVVMETSLHGKDVYTAELTENKFPAMSFYG